MKTFFVPFISGLIFALGLALSGMIQPQKVIGFLDLNNWDPTLIFVMVGAISVHSLVYHLTKHRDSPLLGGKFSLPTRKDIDTKLLIGSALFGIGWGMGGFCPGPALTSIVALDNRTIVFVVMMFIGMFLHFYAEKHFFKS
ncbi:MAG: YeeE/YedE family protein [Oligoflexales bacterium]|nr:YeeE/YedE family protein [Oligoflexales bacterium]